MRILHITATSTLLAKNGIPAVIKGLCDHQNKLDGIEARALSLRAKAEDAGSPYFDNLNNKSFKEYVNLFKPNIVVIHDFYHPQYSSIAYCLKKLHIPFVIEPHGAFGKQAMRKSRIKKIIANNTIFRILIKDSAGFVFTNDGEKKDAVYKKEKAVVIPNGVEKNAVDDMPAKKFNQDYSPVFYFLGRYAINHKGLDFLFDALDILDARGEQLTINMYGYGSENDLNFVHERIAKIKNLTVIDKGTIYDEEKIKALRDANILLLTSRYEGSPMTILDALSFGNPCLVTPGTNVADEIVMNRLGWKSELKADAIADCILKAREDYKKNYATYYDTCRHYVLDNYLWDKIAIQSVKEYKEIISK